MKCTKCGIPLKSHYAFCPNCGAALHSRPRPFGEWVLSALLLAAVAVSIVYMMRNGGLGALLSQFSNATHEARHPPASSSPFPRALMPMFKAEPSGMSVPAGQVLLTDIAGNPVGRITVAVSGGGWVALPMSACVGAQDWRFHVSDAGIQEFSGGILGDGDEVGLWQIENTAFLSGPLIYPVRLDHPLVWASLFSGQTVSFSDPLVRSEQMNVIGLALPASLQEPGVFIQDGRIVGWTFGALSELGYVWKGPAEDNLVVELGVDDFYRQTFEGGREEKMTLAYAMNGDSPVSRLSAFADGFRLSPMLPEAKTPLHLRSDALIAEMRAMITEMLGAGETEWITQVFDARALAGTGDAAFVLDVLKTMAGIEGPAHPLAMIGDIMAEKGALDADGLRQLRDYGDVLNHEAAKNETAGTGGLVIRFSPGAGQIRTRAVLNSRLYQDFVVDTGASVVTIPSGAATSLGLDIRSVPRQKIMTAGGMIEAPEVRLESVELDGWREADITACIVDLPGQPGVGLLGLNYLNRFHMNVDNTEGKLTLEPR